MSRILWIDNRLHDFWAVRTALEHAGLTIVPVFSIAEAEELLQSGEEDEAALIVDAIVQLGDLTESARAYYGEPDTDVVEDDKTVRLLRRYSGVRLLRRSPERARKAVMLSIVRGLRLKAHGLPKEIPSFAKGSMTDHKKIEALIAEVKQRADGE